MLLAIEIGGSKLQLCAGTGDGEIVERRRLIVKRAAGGEGIRAQIAAALPELVARHRPDGIGVGYGGPVEWRTGRIIRSHQVTGWDGFPLREWLIEQTGVAACWVENDSNVAALGEALLGAGRGFSPMFYTNLGSGVGGGLVIDRELYHGAAPGELEIGHLRLDASGTTVEDRCSGWALDRCVRVAAEAQPTGRLAQLLATTPAGGEARHLAAALGEDDPDATRLLAEMARDFALALSHVVHLLHPEVIILGGGLAHVGEPLRAAVAEALPCFVMAAFQPPPPIRLAEHIEDAVPIGALVLAARRLDYGARDPRGFPGPG